MILCRSYENVAKRVHDMLVHRRILMERWQLKNQNVAFLSSKKKKDNIIK